MTEVAAATRASYEAQIRQHLAGGDLQGADLACQAALAADPEDRMAYFLRGAVLFRLGQHEAAIRHSRRAVELGIEDWSNYLYMGLSLAALNRSAEARDAFAQSHRCSPTSPDAAAHYLRETRRVDGPERAEALYSQIGGQIDHPDFALVWKGIAAAFRPPELAMAGYLEATPLDQRGMNLGCGGATFAGWMNIDLGDAGLEKIAWDLENGLPFAPDGSFSFVYSEHFMEHIERKTALNLMRECFRALRSGGQVRIAMPDLDDLIENYRLGAHFPEDDKEFEGFFDGMFHTRGEWLNVAMRAWGHTYLYNFEDLERLLTFVGFTDVRRVALGQSDTPMLANRETRPAHQSNLIAEARKP